MTDTTTSKGFTILDPLLNYDVNKFNNNFTLANNLLGTIICTSTTRPSTNLWDGMTLWETDTRRFVVRVAAAWVIVPGRAVIADVAARTAITTPYDGMMIWRQDMDWHEVYDGTAWRVVGTAHVTSSINLALITNPYNGQLAVTTDTGTLWVRYSGNWTPLNAIKRLEARSSGNEIVTTTEADVTGATLTFSTLLPNTVVKVASVWDVTSTGPTDIFIGTLYVDGVKSTEGEAHGAGQIRATIVMNWTVTLAATGSHTLKLRRQKVNNSNTVELYGIHSKIQVEGAGIV